MTGVYAAVARSGRVLAAGSCAENQDLFWACRGGGGGQLGVVTSLTVATAQAPVISTVFLQWNYANAAAVIRAWHNWAPTADRRLWSTLKLLTGSNHPAPGIELTATWTGPAAELDAQFTPLHAAVGRYPTVNNPSLNRSYLDVMLDDVGVAALLSRIQAGTRLPGLLEGGVSLYALGGVVGTVEANATAFVHRKALATVQYTATYANDADPAPFDAYVRGSRDAMVAQWGNGAYVNYADAAIKDSADAYFGANAGRLRDIKSRFDPHMLFALPQGY